MNVYKQPKIKLPSIDRAKINMNPAREENETWEQYQIRRKMMKAKNFIYPTVKPKNVVQK